MNVQSSGEFIGRDVQLMGTANVTGGRFFADNLQSTGGTLTTDGSSIIAVNSLSGFGPNTNFNGFFTLGEPAGAATASHTVAAGETFTVGQIFAVGQSKQATLTVDGAVQANLLRIATQASANGSAVDVNSGGSLTTNTHLRVGGSFAGPGGTGTLNANAGSTVDVDGTLRVFGPGTVNVATDNLRAHEIDVTGGGIFNTTGTSRVFANQLTGFGNTINFTNRFGFGVGNGTGVASHTVGAGQTFTTGGPMVIGADGATSVEFIVDGGQLNVGSYLDIAEDTFGTASDATLRIINGGIVNSTSSTNFVGDFDAGGATATVEIGGGGAIWNARGPDVRRGTITVNAGGTLHSVTSSLTVRTDGQIDVLGGTLDADTDVNINGGKIFVDAAGAFDPDQDINLNGGTLQVDNNSFSGNWEANNILTAQNDAQVLTMGNYFIRSGQEWRILSGSDMTHTGFFIVGNTGLGTLTVDGPGSTSAPDKLTISQGGGTGVVNVTNDAVMNIGLQVAIAESVSAPGINGTLNVNTGGDVTVGHVILGHNDGDQGTGTINLDGTGSTLTQAGGGILSIGNVDTPGNGGVHTINVIDDSRYSMGTGTTTIRKTGTLNLDTDGEFRTDGNVNLDGGTITQAAGTFFGVDGTLDVMPGGTFNLLSNGFADVDTLALTGGIFNSPSNTTVIQVNRMQSFGSLTTAGLFTVGTAGGSSASDVIIGNGETIDVGNTTVIGFDKAGKVTINSGGVFNTQSDVRIGTVAFAPGHQVDVNAGGLFDIAGPLRIGGQNAANLSPSTVNIDGAGAKVEADGLVSILPGSTVNIANGGALIVNAADIEVPGGALNVNAGGAGGLANSRLALSNSQKLLASNGGQVFIDGNYDIQNNVTFQIADGADLALTGDLDVGVGSDGTLLVDGAGSTLDSASQQSAFGFSGGKATVRISNEAMATFHNVRLSLYDSAITNTVDVESGADLFVDGFLRVAAEPGGVGVFTVDGTGSTFTKNGNDDVTIGSSGTGAGTINVTNSADVITSDGTTTVHQTGTINVNTDGLMRVGSGAGFPNAAFRNSVQVTSGGRLEGNGTINAALMGVGGVIAPGLSPGILTVNGFYTTNANGNLEIEINGVATAGTDYDQLVVSNAVYAQGTLDLLIGGGYVPTLGDEVDFILAGGAISGNRYQTITNVVQSGNLGLAVRHDYDPGQVDMRVSALGDANFDDLVDIADLQTLAGNFGSTGDWSTGDFDGDGAITIADLQLLAGNFGFDGTNPAAPIGISLGDALQLTSVPEPSSIASLIVLGSLSLLRRRCVA